MSRYYSTIFLVVLFAGIYFLHYFLHLDIKSMEQKSGNFIFIGFGILSLFLSVKSYLSLKNFKKNIIENIGQAEEDKYLILQGQIKKSENLIEAPLSKTKCIAYYYRVVDRKVRNERQVFTEAKFSPFTLQDASGNCLINTDEKTRFNPDKLTSKIFFSNQAKPEDAVIHNDILEDAKQLKGQNYRYYEYCLQEGDTVCIQGVFSRKQLAGDELNKKPLVVYYGDNKVITKIFRNNIFWMGLLTLFVFIVSGVCFFK